MGRFSLNGNALIVNNKFVEYNNGVLSFQVSGTHFPFSNYEPPNPSISNFNATSFNFVSSESNSATINYGDGNIISYVFKANGLQFKPSIPLGDALNQPIHSYTDGNSGVRVVKISFAKPDKITEFNSRLNDIYGSFPAEISSISNLKVMTLNQSKLKTFPVSIATLKFLNNILLVNVGTAISKRIPDEFLGLKLKLFSCAGSVDMSDVYSSNLVGFLNSGNKHTLEILFIDSCNLTSLPNEITNLTSLKQIRVGSRNLFETMPRILNEVTSLESLSIGAGTSANPNIRNWSSISNLVNLTELSCGSAENFTTDLPEGMANCIRLKTYGVGSSYNSTIRINSFIANFYNFIYINAAKAGSNLLPFRGMTINCIGASPAGLYQQPIGFILGSNNGSPASPKEMIWVLVNQYGHTITYTP